MPEQFGTVYDVFEHKGEEWAQVEWSVRGNQYQGARKHCNAKPIKLLTLAAKAPKISKSGRPHYETEKE